LLGGRVALRLVVDEPSLACNRLSAPSRRSMDAASRSATASV
jgi:hypothetical protein